MRSTNRLRSSTMWSSAEITLYSMVHSPSLNLIKCYAATRGRGNANGRASNANGRSVPVRREPDRHHAPARAGGPRHAHLRAARNAESQGRRRIPLARRHAPLCAGPVAPVRPDDRRIRLSLRAAHGGERPLRAQGGALHGAAAPLVRPRRAGIALGRRQPRFRLPHHSDRARRTLRDQGPASGRRTDLGPLRADGRQHLGADHPQPARRRRARARRAGAVHHHGRRHPRRGPDDAHPDPARRAADLGARCLRRLDRAVLQRARP